MSASSPAVAEIQGLYGAFSFPEKLLQKLWLRGDFNRAAAATSDGRRVRVLHPGKWNLLGGPDFRGARLIFEQDREVVADIEVHLRAADWDAHGHARDPAYNGVGLHVVLFPPEPGRATTGWDGRKIPILALLPLLHHDLEEYAAEEAIEALANRPTAQVTEELTALAADELARLLRERASARWRQKVWFARLRAQRLGWDAACHFTALEVLGYRFNRPPMLRIAGEHSLAAWASGQIELERVYAQEAEAWSLQGVRPANHPRARLRQYAGWTRARPDWPARWRVLAKELPQLAVADETRAGRRAGGLVRCRERVADEICGGALGGTRLDNFICDGLLPLAAAHDDRALEGVWFHWFSGDLPQFVTDGLRQLAVVDGRAQPACHGFAQGLLGWLIERDVRR